ncbi:MAG: sulfite exporter TauE/SafE family protein [Burkholderia sp.]|nr:sulfite exporter TauE/SafE family protein [Burkholderia sp.]
METLPRLLAADALPLLLAVSATFLVAGLVKGVVGLGLPTVAVGLLGLVMTPMEAASLLLVPSAVTNVWQLAAGPGLKSLLRRLWPMLIGIALGTFAGGAILPRGLTGHATTALGVALMMYAVIGLTAVRIVIPRYMEAWLSPVIGAATGLVTSATGVFVMPAVPYLQGLGLGKEDLVQALGLAFTVSTFSLAANLAFDGAFKPVVAATSFYALVPALVGMLFGQWIRSRIRPEVFRKTFFAGLLALGAHLSRP